MLPIIEFIIWRISSHDQFSELYLNLIQNHLTPRQIETEFTCAQLIHLWEFKDQEVEVNASNYSTLSDQHGW